MTVKRLLCAAALLGVLPAAALAADAVARMHGPDGTVLGTVTFTATESGVVGIVVAVEGLAAGVHAIHVHETGDCSAEDFSSAGDHLAAGHAHGILSVDGPHPGDLPNLYVGATGDAKVDYFNDRISLNEGVEGSLFDTDGSAVVIHAGADDYGSEPSGDAGGRIACGVIER